MTAIDRDPRSYANTFGLPRVEQPGPLPRDKNGVEFAWRHTTIGQPHVRGGIVDLKALSAQGHALASTRGGAAGDLTSARAIAARCKRDRIGDATTVEIIKSYVPSVDHLTACDLAWSTPAAGPNEPAAPVRVLGEELALTMLKSGRHASAVAIELRMEVAAVEKLAESLRPARSGPVTLRAFVVGIEALQPVKLDAGTGDTGAPVWIQLARSGSFAGHPSGKAFKLDATTFGQIVTNFHGNRDRRLPIDFEHACEQDPTEGSIAATGVPAQGWIIDMEVRGSDLWAKVEWGTLARQYIRDGQYRFISPAIHFQMKDRVTGQQIGAYISSAGLTNQPFLDGMQPLAATSRPVGLTARTRALMTAEGLSLKEAESRVMAEMRDEAASP